MPGCRPEVFSDLAWTTAARRDLRHRLRSEAMETFAALHALIDAQLLHIDERLGELARVDRCLEDGSAVAGSARVLAKRAADGRYEVRESAIVAELADLHGALAAFLDLASDACRDDFGDAMTADVLRDLAQHHEKDALVLRALLWEENRP
jgi:DNA-binding ferritin-like protein